MATKSDSDGGSSQGFLVMTPGWATKYYFARVHADLMGDASTDWSYSQLADFKGRALLEVISGTVPGDFLRNDALLLVVSNRVIELLRTNGIETFSTFKVKVVRDGKETPGYVGLAILGKGGPNDPSLVTPLEGPAPGCKSRRIDGIRPVAWDGSDLFLLDDMYRVALSTEKVRTLFKKGKVTNCLFEPAEEFKVRF